MLTVEESPGGGGGAGAPTSPKVVDEESGTGGGEGPGLLSNKSVAKSLPVVPPNSVSVGDSAVLTVGEVAAAATGCKKFFSYRNNNLILFIFTRAEKIY